MNALEIGKKLVELCSQGKNHVAVETLYADDVVSIEAGAPPGGVREKKGLAEVMAKGMWWRDNHEIHSASVTGPFPHDDRFIVNFNYEVTFKPTGKRMPMNEMGLYTTANGKVVREEFFYTTG